MSEKVRFHTIVGDAMYNWPKGGGKSGMIDHKRDGKIINFWGEDAPPSWEVIYYSTPKMTCGSCIVAPNSYCTASWHKDDEFYYVVKGTLSVTINDVDTYDIEAGDMMLIKAGDKHQVFNFRDQEVLLNFVISGNMGED